MPCPSAFDLTRAKRDEIIRRRMELAKAERNPSVLVIYRNGEANYFGPFPSHQEAHAWFKSHHQHGERCQIFQMRAPNTIY